MASIQKLINGWQYRVSYKSNEFNKNGKPVYKTKSQGGFRTKKECELAAAEIDRQLNKGNDINAGDQLFVEYIRNWFELYQRGKNSLEHEKNIERSVRLVEEHFVGVRMKDLSRDMYQKFINDIAPRYVIDTVKKRHTYIKSCLNTAREDGVIIKDPTYKVIMKGLPSEKKEEEKYLNFQEVKRLVCEARQDLRIKYMSRYIILFAIATGARYSEIMGMTWDCIDFKSQAITINKSWDFKDKKDFGKTKNYDSKRTITIDKDTCDMLKELKIKQSELALSSGIRNVKNLCFVNTKMQLVTNNAVNKTLKSLCRKIGAIELTCHGLRHTHGSILLYKGVNIKYISRRLGHKDIVTTLQTYSHILDELEQKESRQVDETMSEIYNTI